MLTKTNVYNLGGCVNINKGQHNWLIFMTVLSTICMVLGTNFDVYDIQYYQKFVPYQVLISIFTWCQHLLLYAKMYNTQMSWNNYSPGILRRTMYGTIYVYQHLLQHSTNINLYFENNPVLVRLCMTKFPPYIIIKVW